MRCLFALSVLLPCLAFADIVTVSGSTTHRSNSDYGMLGSCGISGDYASSFLRVYVSGGWQTTYRDIDIGIPFTRIQDINGANSVNITVASSGCSYVACCTNGTVCLQENSSVFVTGYSGSKTCRGYGLSSPSCGPILDEGVCGAGSVSPDNCGGNPYLYWAVGNVAVFAPITINVECTISFNVLDLDCADVDKGSLVCPEPSPCSAGQIGTIGSAFYTGTHSNPPRYELFELPSDCPKTVVPVSSLPNSSSPAIDNNNQLNVAVSLDQNDNFVSEGWSNEHTQAIFVSAEQTQEQLGCNSGDPDGYFVFCSNVSGSGVPPTHTACSELPCPGGGGGGGIPPNRPPDDVTVFVPNHGGSGGGGNGNGNDFNSNLTKWEDMLKRIIPQSIPNPLPLLGKIYDKLVEFKDFVVDLFEPQDDPEIPDFDEELPELDTLPDYKLDTLPDYDLDSLAPRELDSIKLPDLDSLPNPDTLDIKSELDSNIVDKFKKQLDSLLPDTTKILDKIKEDVLLSYKQMADEIKVAVKKGLQPIEKMLPKGDGACNCLEANFKGLSFGITKGSSVTVGAMGKTDIICDSINVIRRIIMVIVAVTCLGMILATLRR
jgi:hypothetical protein